MDKNDGNVLGFNHSITLVERKNLVISGIKKIDNFDSEEFVIDTNMGILTVKGENLEIIKLDTIQGNISIKGKINSLDYMDDMKEKESKGVFNKLFK